MAVGSCGSRLLDLPGSSYEGLRALWGRYSAYSCIKNVSMKMLSWDFMSTAGVKYIQCQLSINNAVNNTAYNIQ